MQIDNVRLSRRSDIYILGVFSGDFSSDIQRDFKKFLENVCYEKTMHRFLLFAPK